MFLKACFILIVGRL